MADENFNFFGDDCSSTALLGIAAPATVIRFTRSRRWQNCNLCGHRKPRGAIAYGKRQYLEGC